MKKVLFSVFSVLLMAGFAHAQTAAPAVAKLKTRDGNIYFNPNKDQSNKEYSAMTKEATAIFDAESGNVALLVAMKSFHFNNALLEEHFNENYLHTNKFPNAKYNGKLVGYNKAMLAKDGVYKMSSTGTIELHGVTKSFNAPVVMTVKGNTVTFNCLFNVVAGDYNIDIPALVKPKLKDATPLEATIVFKK